MASSMTTGHIQVVAYLDVGWVDSPRLLLTGRSTSGYCVFISNNLISKQSRNKMLLQD